MDFRGKSLVFDDPEGPGSYSQYMLDDFRASNCRYIDGGINPIVRGRVVMSNSTYPPVNKHNYGEKKTLSLDKLSIHGPCSIAMLGYQREPITNQRYEVRHSWGTLWCHQTWLAGKSPN